MRPHGHARVNARHPEALGICYRCGFTWNRNDLVWQFDWQFSARLHNTGTLVCPDCIDLPQPSGRPITLPPDPIAIEMPSPEYLAQADNPVSYVGYNPENQFTPLPLQSLGANIGNMTLYAGVNAAFDSATNKRYPFSAGLAISQSSFQNTLGKNWNAYPSGIALTMPSTATPITHIVSDFALYAPSDRKFLNSASGVTGFHLNGSFDGIAWTTLFSGTTAGTVGETVTATTTATSSWAYHQIAFQGDGISAISVAQVVFNVSDAFPNDI